jgi:hypothetical protein
MYTTPYNLKDTNCKKGQVAQQPPIPCIPVTSILKISTSTELIKNKLNVAGDLIRLEGFEDGDKKKYVKHLMTLQHLQATKGLEEKLALVMRKLGDKNMILKVLRKLHIGRPMKPRNSVFWTFPRLGHKSLSNNIWQRSWQMLHMTCSANLFMAKPKLNGTA